MADDEVPASANETPHRINSRRNYTPQGIPGRGGVTGDEVPASADYATGRGDIPELNMEEMKFQAPLIMDDRKFMEV